MSTAVSYSYGPSDQLQAGREVIRAEGQALLALSQRLSREFCDAADLIYSCQGSVIISGMGKAGLVGSKIVATLASTGTPSHFLHPGEAMHGDLGRVVPGDVVLLLSFSGETEEILCLLDPLGAREIPVMAITGKPSSRLGRAARVTLDLGPLDEACPLGLAPTTSTTAMMAMGDALAMVLSRMRQFRPQDFARYHPAGSLGRRLSLVEDVMRPLSDCRVSQQSKSVRQMLIDVSRPGRRTGAIMLTDDERGALTGVFTDSDLARLLENQRDSALDSPVSRVMTCHPTVIEQGDSLSAAIRIFAEGRISELPVVKGDGCPIGLIDVTDIMGLLPDTGDLAETLSQSVQSEHNERTTVLFPRSDSVPRTNRDPSRNED